MALYSESPKLFTTEFNLLKKCLSLVSREFKLYVYGKRQTSDSRWEFLKIENEQIKTVKKILMDKKLSETTNLGVEIRNSKRQVKRKLGHVVQIRVCRST